MTAWIIAAVTSVAYGIGVYVWATRTSRKFNESRQ